MASLDGTTLQKEKHRGKQKNNQLTMIQSRSKHNSRRHTLTVGNTAAQAPTAGFALLFRPPLRSLLAEVVPAVVRQLAEVVPAVVQPHQQVRGCPGTRELAQNLSLLRRGESSEELCHIGRHDRLRILRKCAIISFWRLNFQTEQPYLMQFLIR